MPYACRRDASDFSVTRAIHETLPGDQSVTLKDWYRGLIGSQSIEKVRGKLTRKHGTAGHDRMYCRRCGQDEADRGGTRPDPPYETTE